MNLPEPIDNYTDSDDEDTVVIESPKPPTPPKATRLLGLGKTEVNLTIDTTLPDLARDDDKNTDNGEHLYYCPRCGIAAWLVGKMCLGCTKLFRFC